MAAVRHIGFKKFAVFYAARIDMPFCFLIQNFAEIGQLVDELWPKKTDFQDGGRRHLKF